MEGVTYEIRYGDGCLLQEVMSIIQDIHENEKERILQAAKVVADQVAKDKLVYIWDPGGHSNLAAMEVFFRDSQSRNHALDGCAEIHAGGASSRLRTHCGER